MRKCDATARLSCGEASQMSSLGDSPLQYHVGWREFNGCFAGAWALSFAIDGAPVGPSVRARQCERQGESNHNQAKQTLGSGQLGVQVLNQAHLSNKLIHTHRGAHTRSGCCRKLHEPECVLLAHDYPWLALPTRCNLFIHSLSSLVRLCKCFWCVFVSPIFNLYRHES